MFIKLLCLYLAVTCVNAAPPTDVLPLEKQQPTVIPIISQSEELEANGTYKFSYETANGIKREETSYDKVLPKAKSGASSNEGGEESDESNEIHVQQGSYSYTAPDGTVITVRYIADENGFRPIGDHLPKAPTVAPASTAGRRAKTIATDNSEVGSAPAPAVAAKSKQTEASEVPEVSKAPSTENSEGPLNLGAPKPSEGAVASKTEKPPTPEAPQTPEEVKGSGTQNTPEDSEAPKSPVPESRLGDVSAEQVSTTESLPESSTAEVSSEATTGPEEPSTTSISTIETASSTTEQAEEVTSTAAADQSTTSELASTTEASEPSTSEASSEAASTTVSESSTPELPSSTSASEEPTTSASSTASSEVTTGASAPSA